MRPHPCGGYMEPPYAEGPLHSVTMGPNSTFTAHASTGFMTANHPSTGPYLARTDPNVPMNVDGYAGCGISKPHVEASSQMQAMSLASGFTSDGVNSTTPAQQYVMSLHALPHHSCQ
jgi:hypothetical protein